MPLSSHTMARPEKRAGVWREALSGATVESRVGGDEGGVRGPSWGRFRGCWLEVASALK